MAQQARLIEMLAAGILDSTGTPVASGYARFYQPGTTTPITVYSDETATATLSQPVSLDAGGRAEVYTLVPCRLIAKKSDDATTVFDGNPNYVDATMVSIKNSAVNSGAETTLDALLTNSAGNLGSYQEATGAQLRSYTARLRDEAVSVKDYGALGDGAQDDTAYIQAALDRCAASGKPLKFPTGVYLVNGQLSIGAITTSKFSILGDGPKSSIIKQSSTSASTLVFNYVGSTDYGGSIRDIGITASTTSSGSAISDTNANNLVLHNVEVALHRTGFAMSGCTGSKLLQCSVLSTDGNAAAVGVSLGASALVLGGVYTGSSSAGTGISSSGNSVTVADAAISGWATGVSLSGTSCNVSGGSVGATTSGVSVTGASSRVQGLTVTIGNAGTGVTLGAANCRAEGLVVSGTTSTTGISATTAGAKISDCVISGCATGITSSQNDHRIYSCEITTSTVNAINASGTGVVIRDCKVSGTGTGLTMSGANGSAVGGSVSGYTTGATLTAAGCQLAGMQVSSNTTGVNIGANNCMVRDSIVSGSTTGVTLGAFSGCSITGNVCSTNTTDISINASATTYVLHGNSYTTLTDSAAVAHSFLNATRLPWNYTKTSNSGVSPSWTPTITSNANGDNFNVWQSTYSAGSTTLTINATSTTGLRDGDRLWLFLNNAVASANTLTITWNAQYQQADETNTMGGGGWLPSMASLAGSGNANHAIAVFRWKASTSKWVCMGHAGANLATA